MELDLISSGEQWNKALEANNLQAPFLTHEWHTLWFETIGSEWKPLVLFFDEVIFPFAVKEKTVILSGGYETTDYLDSLGPDAQKPGAWKKALVHLKEKGLTTLELRNIPQNSSTLAFLKEKGDVIQEDTTPLFTLPSTWDEYVSSLPRKYRHELRRKVKKFEASFEDTKVEEVNDKHKGLIELLNLMRMHPDKDVFLTPLMQQYLEKLIGSSVSSHILLLATTVKGEIAAMTMGFVYDQTLFLYNSGFDETKFSGSGFYLKAMGIKYAIEKGLKKYNFLQGNERYKYELGGQDFFVYKATIDL